MHVESAIKARRTIKVLAHGALPTTENRSDVEELLSVAGMAPFHRACDEVHRVARELGGIEPWRFYALDANSCRRLAVAVPQENAGKIPSMLLAADAMILATWLPNPAANVDCGGPDQFEPTLANMEHIAAASAAIQNLLLAATAREIENYWSSGGVLRLPAVFQMLGIPTNEILLGAVFLFPKVDSIDTTQAEIVPSKLREKRMPPPAWSKWLRVE